MLACIAGSCATQPPARGVRSAEASRDTVHGTETLPAAELVRGDSVRATRDTLARLAIDRVGRLAIERTWGRFGIGSGELSAPEGVAVDALGRLFLADTGNHRIVRYDSSGVALGEFGGFGYDAQRFNRPTQVFVGGTLACWVLDAGNARIVKYDLEGRLLGLLVELRSDAVRERLGLVEPAGLAADAGGKLYVTDTAGDRVIVFDPLGAVLSTFGGFGAQEGRFDAPWGIAVDGRGRVLVADAGHRRLQLLDSFGGFVAAVPLDAGMTGREGVAVAFAPDGRWAAADRATGRVAVHAAAGALEARHVPGGKADFHAAGVAFDARGRLYATDARQHRVARFRRIPTAP